MSDNFKYIGSELEVFASAVNWKRYFTSLIEPFIQGNVLEVGAGIGGTTRILASHKVESWTCLEPDCNLASIMKEVFESDAILKAIPLKIIEGNIQNLSRNVSYNTILYIDVLEHIEEDREELRKAASLLAPGGSIVVLSPAHQFLFSPFDQAIGHFRRYSRSTLKLIAPGGLNQIRLDYIDSIGFFASLVNRLFLKSKKPSLKQILFWDQFMIPLSRITDPLFCYLLGKSILGVWNK